MLRQLAKVGTLAILSYLSHDLKKGEVARREGRSRSSVSIKYLTFKVIEYLKVG